MSITVITVPEVEPILAAEARTRLGFGSDVADATINSLIKGAREQIERQYSLALINQTLELTSDYFPGIASYPPYYDKGFYPRVYDSPWRPTFCVGKSDLLLPQGQVQTITTVKYLDTGGVEQTIDSADYTLQKGDLQSRIILAYQQSWPSALLSTGAIRVRFDAGFGADGSAVPERIKSAILLLVKADQSMLSQDPFVVSDMVYGVGQKSYSVSASATDMMSQRISSLLQDYIRPSL